VAAGQPVQHSVRIRTADAVTLAGVEAGSGRRGVLLLPEVGSGGGLCGWLDFANHLAGHGFRTLAIDHRCLQESGCGVRGPNELVLDIEAAVARLRADGAATVSIIGASQGASEALIFGAAPPRSVAGVVDRVVCLSSDELTLPLAAAPYPATAPAAARRMTRPVMYVVSDGDQYVSVAATKSMYDSTPALGKRLVTLPAGDGHGWRLVDDLTSTTTAQVVAFLGAG
jgi:pimeloyl-ACP methyl ester carboxylesterase